MVEVRGEARLEGIGVQVDCSQVVLKGARPVQERPVLRMTVVVLRLAVFAGLWRRLHFFLVGAAQILGRQLLRIGKKLYPLLKRSERIVGDLPPDGCVFEDHAGA